MLKPKPHMAMRIAIPLFKIFEAHLYILAHIHVTQYYGFQPLGFSRPKNKHLLGSCSFFFFLFFTKKKKKKKKIERENTRQEDLLHF
jgi:hypothetical protein